MKCETCYKEAVYVITLNDDSKIYACKQCFKDYNQFLKIIKKPQMKPESIAN